MSPGRGCRLVQLAGVGLPGHTQAALIPSGWWYPLYGDAGVTPIDLGSDQPTHQRDDACLIVVASKPWSDDNMGCRETKATFGG